MLNTNLTRNISPPTCKLLIYVGGLISKFYVGGLKRNWLVCIAFLLGLPCLAVPIANPDLFRHLSAGNFILSYWKIPRVDFLSWTLEGQPWLDIEWLTQIFYVAIHHIAGMGGLWVLRTFLLAATVAVVIRMLGLYDTGRKTKAVAVLALCCALTPSSGARPENFSLLFFSIQLLYLELIRLEEIRQSRWHLIALASGYVLWANIHPGFIYGLLLIFLYAIGQYPSHKKSFSKFLSRGQLFAASAIGTLVNPFGWRLYGAIWEDVAVMGRLGGIIQEYTPPGLSNPWQFPFWLVLSFAIALVWISYRIKSCPLPHILVLGAMAVLALVRSRNTGYFAIAAVPLAARAWLDLPQPGHTSVRRFGGGVVLASVFAASFFFTAKYVLPYYERAAGAWDKTRFPTGLPQFLSSHKSALSGHRMLAPWDWGGYLGLKLHPSYKVFVDGRYIFHSFLDEIRKARREVESWQSFLRKHGIQVAVIRRDPRRYGEIIGKTKYFIQRPLYNALMPQDYWALVYWDSNAMVFVRREGPVDRLWLGNHEYRFYRPDDRHSLAFHLAAKRLYLPNVRWDILRHIRESRNGAEALEMLNWLRSAQKVAGTD